MNPLLRDFSPIDLATLPDHPALLSCRYDANVWTSGSGAEYGIVIPNELEQAVPKRLAEFVAGRVLAHRLLESAGCAVPVGYLREQRYPVWPAGYTGSISHSSGLAVCMVADTSSTLAVGLDVEHWMADATAASVGPRIATQDEIALLTAQGWGDVAALTAVFSAKEALFKALYPLTQTFFGFDAAIVCGVALTGAQGTLKLEIGRELGEDILPGSRFDVHIQQQKDFVLTVLYLAK